MSNTSREPQPELVEIWERESESEAVIRGLVMTAEERYGFFQGYLAGRRAEWLKGQQTAGVYQKCPKCDGQGLVEKPPYLAAEVSSWVSTQANYVCNVCNGAKIIATPSPTTNH